MKLADLATGPDWIIWTVFVVFAVLSIILLSGHGSWFISGYNMASKEEKEKYDEKKLCRTTGIGMSIIAILILIMGLFENFLSAFFIYIAVGISVRLVEHLLQPRLVRSWVSKQRKASAKQHL